LGIAVQVDTELQAGTFPPEWQEDLVAVISSIWSVLPQLENWNPHRGWGASATVSGNPYPSACFLAIALLAGLPPDACARAADVERWVIDRHPYWPAMKPQAVGLQAFLLGFAGSLRLLHAAQDANGAWLVRLSPLGRGVLGVAARPPAPPEYPQTLLVQPNLEI